MDYPKHITTLLNKFSRYLITRKSRAKSTETAYIYSIKLFINFYSENINRSLETLTVDEDIFEKYLYYLKQKPNKYKPDQLISSATISRHLAALRTFWAFLYRQDRAPSPMTLEEMEIEHEEQSNATKPLRADDCKKFTEDLHHVLNKIY